MRIWHAGAILLVAVASMAGFLAARERPVTAKAGPVPAIRSVALESAPRAGEALLLVRPFPARALPGAFDHPYDERDVLVNDLGRDGDRHARDGIYSARVRFDAAAFERRVRAAAERLSEAKPAAPPAFSTRFDPVARRTKRSVAAGPAADRAYRARVLRETASALAVFKLPSSRRPGEIFHAERFGGSVAATLFGRPVHADLLAIRSTDPEEVDPDRSLVITDLQVIADPTRTYDPCGGSAGTGNPDGAWSFKHLMTEMANESATGIPPAQFVRRWIELGLTPQTANDFATTLPAQSAASILNNWPTDSDGELDLDRAPFRLLAIVSRTDLMTLDPAGGYGGGAGELRFVFGTAAAPCGPPEPHTVILEYRVNRRGCEGKRGWVQQWFDLGDGALGMGPGSDYNARLEELTESVVAAGADANRLPNESAISQIRTNELVPNPWMMQEFRLNSSGQPDPGLFGLVTVKQTPDISFHQTSAGAALLAAYINGNQAALLTNSHVVPFLLPGGHAFLGAEAPVPTSAFTWTTTVFSTPVDPQALTNFSIATCSGCHAGDTQTSFTHISPRLPGAAAQISAFMRNANLFDEDDLERRQRMMSEALDAICPLLPMMGQLPPGFQH